MAYHGQGFGNVVGLMMENLTKSRGKGVAECKGGGFSVGGGFCHVRERPGSMASQKNGRRAKNIMPPEK